MKENEIETPVEKEFGSEEKHKNIMTPGGYLLDKLSSTKVDEVFGDKVDEQGFTYNVKSSEVTNIIKSAFLEIPITDFKSIIMNWIL